MLTASRVPLCGIIGLFVTTNLLTDTPVRAALTYSTLSSVSLNSTLTGPLGSWVATLNNQSITDSRSVDTRYWQGVSKPAGGYGFSAVRVTTMGMPQPGGPIDFISIAHDLGTTAMTSWNSSGSVTMSFDRAILFYFSSGVGNTWSFEGTALTQGTRFEAGNYSFSFAGTFNAAAGLREWTTSAYFMSATVPAPGAAIIFAAAGLLGRRRRA